MNRSRRGFTLLELILALTLTAMAVGVASTALSSATTVKERVMAHRDAMEREARFRLSLTDMLRHAPSANAVDEPLIRVVPSTERTRQLVFLSTGLRAPFGTGPTWRVTLTSTDSGLLFDAVTIGSRADGTILHAVIPELTTMHVRFLEPTTVQSPGRWREDWPLVQSRPGMVSMRFSDDVNDVPWLFQLNPLANGVTRP